MGGVEGCCYSILKGVHMIGGTCDIKISRVLMKGAKMMSQEESFRFQEWVVAGVDGRCWLCAAVSITRCVLIVSCVFVDSSCIWVANG